MAPTTATKKAAAPKKAANHPTFLAMIQEAVKAASGAEARAGVSRPALKKFLADKYKIDMSSKTNANLLATAITRGSTSGQLSLPKGVSGRVKLGAEASKKKTPAPAAGKENAPPKPAAKKPAAKPAAKKPAAAKPATKTAAKPAAKAAAKPAAKKTAAKPAAKKPAAKKTAAPKKPAAAKAAAGTKAAPKKAAPKKAAAKKA